MSVDTDTLDQCLKGITFPADMRAVSDCTRGNSCPQDVVSRLESTSDWMFNSREELYCQLGDESSCRASTW